MGKWNIDAAHTNAEFVVTHMMFSKVRGKFEDVQGVINFDPANPGASSVEATIQTATVSTGVADRDNHLRSADFFDAETFPVITFKSTNVVASSDTKATIAGDLTIRDVTKEVTLEVEFLGQGTNPWGMTVAGFTGTTKINRENFGLTWNQVLEAGGVLVSKEIEIQLNVQAALEAETENA